MSVRVSRTDPDDDDLPDLASVSVSHVCVCVCVYSPRHVLDSPFAVQSLCIRASASVSTEQSNFSRSVQHLWHTARNEATARWEGIRDA